MVARTPPKQRKMVAPLNPTLLRETLNKVEKSIARLQELQYTVAGGTKLISGVSLSPRSTKGYLKTSLKCKHECLRIKIANSRKSPPGKLPTSTGEWQRMSLPAMLVGETVGEILQASQFAREIVEAVAAKSEKSPTDDPKTPATLNRTQRPNPENSELRARRNREKQNSLQSIRSESHTPSSLHRARSRINFKASPPLHNKKSEKENSGYRANRVSPRNRPWARKTVLFPNPLFHSSSSSSSSSSPTSNHHKFCKTKSPIIAARNRQTPHKFLIRTKSPPPSACKFQVKIKSPPPAISLSPTRALTKRSPKKSTAAKLRRSFSPSRLASRLVSPLKSRKSVQKSDGLMMIMMSGGLKQRQISVPMRFSAPRI